MQEDLMLVLSVYQGQGIPPKEGWTVLVTANLDGYILDTDPVPLTTEPKFRQEISWNLSTAILRQHKRARVPVRVECHAVNKHDNRQTLGYIVLPLSSAVKGRNIDPQWHKLLGGPSAQHKTPPSLLLCLNVLPNTSTAKKDEATSANDDSDCASPNGRSAESMDVDPRHSPAEIMGKRNRSVDSVQSVEVLSSDSRMGNGRARSDGRRLSREDEVRIVGEGFAGGRTPRRSDPPRTPRETRECRARGEERDEDVEDSPAGDGCGPRRSRRRLSAIPASPVARQRPSDGGRDDPSRTRRGGCPPQSHPDGNNGFRKGRQSNALGSPRENGHRPAQSSGPLAVALPGTSRAAGARTDSTRVIPRLNQGGGFFQIGPVGEPDEEAFHFSVTIVYAKYLNEVIPRDLEIAETDQVRFCYSLLGHIVYTDPIRDLADPDFAAERTAGKVCSTPRSVSAYFQQHPELPVHLLVGDVCLATASIGLSSFAEALTAEAPLTVEGTFPLVPVMIDPLTWSPARKPALGCTVQLSVSAEGQGLCLPPVVKEDSVLMVDYLSSSSSSDSEEECFSTQEGDQRRFRVRRRRDLPERWPSQRKSLTYEAAMEVETWKENQQHLFWKQWSAREAELQHHLASEWQARISSMEAQLERRLGQCDNLHRRLTEALTNVTIKEKNVALREEKVRMIQEDLERKEQRLMYAREKFYRKTGQRSKNVRDSDDFEEQLAHERKVQRQLQRQVRELEAANRAAGDSAEAAQLGSQVKMQEIEDLNKDREFLTEQLSVALKRKRYYKMQWVRSVGQVHHLHTSHIHQANDLRLDVEQPSPEPYYVRQQPNKHLKYKEDNHRVYAGGEEGRPQVKWPAARLNSDNQSKTEPKMTEESKSRKGVGPGKSSKARQRLEDILKERQELEKQVRKRAEIGESSSHHSSAILDSETKI